MIRRRPSPYAVLQVVGWTAYGLVGVAMTAGFAPLTPRLAVTMLLGAAAGGLGSHLLREAIRRGGWLARPAGALVPRLVGAVLVVALAIETTILLIGIYVTGAYTWKTSTPGILLATSFNWIFTLALWAALYVGVRSFVRWRDSEIRRLQLEVLARDAQLDALNAQIQPHFLFNALNVLRAMIPEDPALARDLVTELSELMRYALMAGRRERVPLAEELAVCESYLKIEAARFEDRLRWTIRADDDVRRALLPPMLLQMLVENAVKHGVAAELAGGEVAVSADLVNGAVRLVVTNPGRLGGRGGTRIGLANAAERLRLLYGGRASLTLAEEAEGVRAEVRLPAESVAS